MAVDHIAQLRVTRDLLYTENRRYIVALVLILKTSLELKKRGVLEVEHRPGAAIVVGQLVAHTALSPLVGDQICPFGQLFQQSAKTKLLRPSAASPPHDVQ